MTHPFVIGEIALGAGRRTDEVVDLLEHLPALPMAAHHDVLNMVERRALAGRGIGWVDAHLVAAALLAQTPLWTLDRALSATAGKLAVAWTPGRKPDR